MITFCKLQYCTIYCTSNFTPKGKFRLTLDQHIFKFCKEDARTTKWGVTY